MVTAANYRERIIALWTVFLLGILFHTQLGLMPLFHGLSVMESQKATNINDISGIMWLMWGFFVLPMLAIIMTVFTDSNRYRIIHFSLTVFYSIMNLLHVILDLFVQPILWYQIALMVLLFFVGLLLNITVFQWMKMHNRANQSQGNLESSHF
jgi:FlaA1/EpsC-like NDP-sugar epimerase